MGQQPLKASVQRVVVPVQDYALALHFYSKLFHATSTPVSEGRTYFDLGGINLCVYHPESDGDEPVGQLSTPVYLTVDDVDLAYENAAQAGANGIEPVERRPWGERSFYCFDPSGNRLCFVEDRSMFRGEFYVE